MDVVKSFEDFLNEGRIVVKRKYTEFYPQAVVSSNAPVRERILSFVKERKEVTHNQLMEFIQGLNEETGSQTSRKWVNKNAKYFDVKEKHSTKYYSLSKMGARVQEAILKQKTI